MHCLCLYNHTDASNCFAAHNQFDPPRVSLRHAVTNKTAAGNETYAEGADYEEGADDTTYPEELEEAVDEPEAYMTQAKKYRSEMEQAREFYRTPPAKGTGKGGKGRTASGASSN